MITGAEVRAARKLLGWTQKELASKSRIGGQKVSEVEKDKLDRVLEAFFYFQVQAALEQVGVIFVDENGEGPGVRLRKGK